MKKKGNPVSKAQERKKSFCYGYPSDLDQAYAFYCARYENISYSEFLNLGFIEFNKKFNSMPETEPLFKIIKSRNINLSKIKDKEERKYWAELKSLNQIPNIYLSDREIRNELIQATKNIGKLK